MDHTTTLQTPPLKDRLFTIGLWTVLLTLAWSLPVMGVITNLRGHERMESGIYYTPKMPAEWYVQKDITAPDADLRR